MFWNMSYFLRNNLEFIFKKIGNNNKILHLNVFLSKYFFTNCFILVTMYKLNTC